MHVYIIYVGLYDYMCLDLTDTRGLPQPVSTLVFEIRSPIKVSDGLRQTCWGENSGNLPVSVSQYPALWALLQCPAFYMGPGNQNSGTFACYSKHYFYYLISSACEVIFNVKILGERIVSRFVQCASR